MFDLIIIGSGVSGLSSAIYAGRYNLKTLVLGKEFGGETIKAGIIWNYPGIEKADGYEMMKTMAGQARSHGAEMKEEAVVAIEKRPDGNFEVKTAKNVYSGKAIVFANGSKRRELGLPNEVKLKGRGVHYCITCDGPVYKGKTIAIVGGGDASVKAAILASEYAGKIYLLVRDQIRAEPTNIEEMKRLGDKVEILLQTEVKDLVGENKLEKIVLTKEFNGLNELKIDGLFVEIGSIPDTEIAGKIGVSLEKNREIIVDNFMNTNIAGVFASGDITSFFGSFKQCITGAAMGAVAAMSAYKYIRSKI